MSKFDFIFTDINGAAVQRPGMSDMIEGLRWVNLNPGGNGEATFRIPAARRSSQRPVYLDYNYDVQIGREGQVHFRGRVEDIQWKDGYFEVTVGGYGLALKDQRDTVRNVQNTETSTIVANAIANLVPHITTTSITSTGFTLSNTAPVNLVGMNAAAQIVWCSYFGNTSFEEQSWYVYPDADGTVRFIFKPRPTVANILLDELDADDLGWGLSGYAVANRVRVNYNSGASWTSQEDSVIQSTWDRIIEMFAKMPQVSTSADADQVANTILSTFKVVKMRANTAVLGASSTIVDDHRLRKMPWEVRAGDLVQIKDIDAAVAGSALSYSNSFMVVESEYIEDGNQLRLMPESFDTMIERSIAKTANVLAGLQQIP